MMRASLAGVLALLVAGCGGSGPYTGPSGNIPFEPQRPTPGTPVGVAPYTGEDPLVLEAQSRLSTGADLQRKVVLRTCGPTNGVCHNQKEYPDLHTAGTFAAAINAPCNVQAGSYEGVYDRCERLGDRFKFTEQSFKEIEIGWYAVILGAYEEYPDQFTPPDDAPGFHIHLRDPVPLAQGKAHWGTGTFIRNFINAQGNVEALSFASYNTRWWVLGDGRHLFGEVRDYQRDAVDALLSVGILQGDQNRNGVFGAREGKSVPLLNPGKPEESYLVARMRGHMQGEAIPGSRMPLANQPPSIPDMLALMCFIEGLDPAATQWNLSSSIDYARCSYSANPQALSLVGTGVTWRQRVQPILQSSCGGCHGGSSPQGGLDLLSAGTWARLRQPSAQNPNLKLIDSGRPETSYLWLKLSGDGSILGARMPVDPLNGNRTLPPEQLADIEAWILGGALEDG
ncbi:c-type cytochrome domain-containing protein [Stigmatella erecta]|uniref:Planctomycete cytochrome C n=1 Tax=Stigmatella erecta TaxID=83460 RepID=A0A1I0KI05_9BACT|nr:c-type cytochrome domain-containing protein [Stigmatella erecta]SEU24239.1 Planctomycete cytochrome C [Stigmatella erecta]